MRKKIGAVLATILVAGLAGSLGDTGSSARAHKPSSKSKPAQVNAEFFGDMTLRLKSDLKVQSLHGEGPSSYDVACIARDACPAFSVYRPNEVGGDLNWKTWDLLKCGANQATPTFGPSVFKGMRKIGNKPAKYYEAEPCVIGVPLEVARFWEATDGSILIVDTSGNRRWRSDEDKILSTATWR